MFNYRNFISLVWIVALVSCGSLKDSIVSTSHEPITDETIISSVSAEPTISAEINEPREITLLAVGDNLIHEPIYTMAKREQGYDFLPTYEFIAEEIAAADIAFLEQEVLVSGESYIISAWPSFNSPKELARDMALLGFDIVNLANNHIMDKDIWCLEESLRVWESLQIPYIGVYDSRKEDSALRVITVDDCRLAFLGYCYGLNSWEFADSWHFQIGNLHDRQRMSQDIAQAQQLADIVIVSMHWGEEYQLKQNSFQQELAHWLAGEGVDLVIGHHPHVIQPVELIAKADGRQMPVIYSLGNFVSTQRNPASLLGAMLKINVYQKDEGEWEVGVPKLSALISHYEAVASDNPLVQILPLADYSEELATRHDLRSEASEVDPRWFQELFESVIASSYR